MHSLFRNSVFTSLLLLSSFAFAQSQDEDAAALQSLPADQRATQQHTGADSDSNDEEQEARASQSEDEAEATVAYQEHAAKSPSGGGDEGDICGVILCMAGGSNSVAPHECKPYVEAYFKVRVYKRRRFRPIPTAVKRYDEVLNQCPDAEPQDRDRINAMFGTLEYSPFVFD